MVPCERTPGHSREQQIANMRSGRSRSRSSAVEHRATQCESMHTHTQQTQATDSSEPERSASVQKHASSNRSEQKQAQAADSSEQERSTSAQKNMRALAETSRRNAVRAPRNMRAQAEASTRSRRAQAEASTESMRCKQRQARSVEAATAANRVVHEVR